MPDENDLGRQFRALRQARGLSLTEVAEATEISSSFLSLFETGKSDIAFGRLTRLVGFFGVGITELIPDLQPEQTIVVPRNQRRRLESRSENAAIDLLTHQRHAMLPLIVTLEPGGAVSGSTVNTEGGELFVLILQGEIEVDDGENEPVHLRRGDAAYYLTNGGPTDRALTFRNVTPRRAECLTVRTPSSL